MSVDACFREPSNRYLYAIFCYIKRFVFLKRSLVLKKVSLEGTDKSGTGETSLIYIGEGESFAYFKELCFSQVTKEDTARLPLWSLRKFLTKAPDSGGACRARPVVIVDINRSLAPLIPAGGFLTYPWIRQKVELDTERYQSRRRSIEGVYGRKARKYGHRLETTKDADLVMRFHEEFYLPYIKHRYHEDAHHRSLNEFSGILSSGFLFQLFEGERWISGALCKIKDKELTAVAFGVMPDYADHLRRGALSSLYYLIFKWARENGIDTVDLLRSRPHKDDGVFIYKRRWGAREVVDGWPHTSIWIFPPKDLNASKTMPKALKGQFVWNKNAFITLEESMENERE